MAGDAIEVRESIEAKGDVEMSDVQDTVAARRYSKDDGDADADGELDADGDFDMDADGEPDDDAEQAQNQESIDLLQLIKQTTEYLCEYTVNEGEEEYVAFVGAIGCPNANVASVNTRLRSLSSAW